MIVVLKKKMFRKKLQEKKKKEKIVLKEMFHVIRMVLVLKVKGTSERFSHFNSLRHNPRLLKPLANTTFENIVGKGENAVNQHFPLFPQCFLLFPT